MTGDILILNKTVEGRSGNLGKAVSPNTRAQEFALTSVGSSIKSTEYTSRETGDIVQTNDHLDVSLEEGEAFLVRDKETGSNYAAPGYAKFKILDDEIVLATNDKYVLLVGKKGDTVSSIQDLVPATVAYLKYSDVKPTTECTIGQSVIKYDQSRVLQAVQQTIDANVNSAHELIIPGKQGTGSRNILIPGMRFIASVPEANGRDHVFEYGGIAKTKQIGANTQILGAGSAVAHFQGIGEDAGGLRFIVNNIDKEFSYHPNPNANQRQFNSLKGLKDLLNNDPDLIATEKDGVLYIAPKNGNYTLRIEDLAGGTNFKQTFGLDSVADPENDVKRFTNLYDLYDKINRIAELKAKTLDSRGEVVDPTTHPQSVKSVSFGASSALQSTTMNTSVNHSDNVTYGAWQTSRQAYVTKSRAEGGKVQIYAPRHGLKEGSFVEIERFAAAGNTVDANGVNGKKRVIAVTPDSFTVAVADAGHAVQVANCDGARVQAFDDTQVDSIRFHEIAALSYNREVLNATQFDIVDNVLTITAGNNYHNGDRIFIPGLQAVLSNAAGYDAATFAPDQIYTVAQEHAGHFDITIGARGAVNDNARVNDGGGVAITANLTVQKVSDGGVEARIAHVSNAGGADWPTNHIRIYQKDALQKCRKGDTVEISGIGGGGGFVMQGLTIRNQQYQILKVARDANNGEYFVIEGEGNAVAEDWGTYANLTANFKVQYLSSNANAFGWNRKYAGANGNTGKAYDAEGIVAPNMADLKRVMYTQFPEAQKNLEKYANFQTTRFIHTFGERKIALNFLILDEENIAFEVAVQRDEGGRYHVEGMDENGNGILKTGTLKFRNGKIEDWSALRDSISVRWISASNNEVAENNVKFNLAGMRFGTYRADNFVFDADGQKPGHMKNGEQDLRFDSHSKTIKIAYDNGKDISVYNMFGVEKTSYVESIPNAYGFRPVGDNVSLVRPQMRESSEIASSINKMKEQMGVLDLTRNIKHLLLVQQMLNKNQDEQLKSIGHTI